VEKWINCLISQEVAAVLDGKKNCTPTYALDLIVAGVLTKVSFSRLGFAVLRVWLPDQGFNLAAKRITNKS
jgi:hypothetical protein